MFCVSSYFCQACFVCSLGLHICNVAAEVLEFLWGGVKSHDPLGTIVLGNHTRRHPKTQWPLLQIVNEEIVNECYNVRSKYIFNPLLHYPFLTTESNWVCCYFAFAINS